MTEKSKALLFALVTVVLGVLSGLCFLQGDSKTGAALALAIAALYLQPPQKGSIFAPRDPGSVGLLLLILPLSACTGRYAPFGLRSSSLEMTPQASNPIAAGVGGIYTKSSDNKPRLVDASSTEYIAGEARHVFTNAGAPGGAVLGDCWTDSTDGYKVWCKESAGNLRQRADLTAPGTLGCGTPAAACFTSITLNGAPTDATFARSCTITSAAAATPVNCLADSDVPPSRRAYLLGWRAKVNGPTPWATTATCSITDTSSVGFVDIAVAALAGDAFLNDSTANVAQADAYALNLGSTTDKGLQVVCNANGTGSSLVVTVFGVIK